MAFHAISKKFDKPFSNKGKDLVVQFSVKHEGYSYGHCAGGYLKLLPGAGGKDFGGDTKYNIMFGPDMCSYDVSRIHLIFNKGAENLLKKDEIKLEYDDKNEFTHLYTLHIKPDGDYEVFFDLESKAKGKIVEDWPFPKPTIDDPSDKKPSDWVDETEIDDPAAKKPDGYDDIPKTIVDPAAKKPDDWDDESDGEWEAPTIDNPEYKGEWKPKRISNKAYKGKWEAPDIDNPDFVDDPELYAVVKDNGLVGFELWQVRVACVRSVICTRRG